MERRHVVPRFNIRKKGLIAGALLGCMGLSAHAQSSVTLYGVVDAGLLYTSKSFNPLTGQNTGHQFSALTGGLTPSLFGLRGSEDLGGGLKAIFDLESGFDMTNGSFTDSNGNLFGRKAYVGIASNYGTVKAGVQESPFVTSLIALDPRNVAYFGSGVPIYVGGVFVTGIFNSNAISYMSPTIAGFKANAMLALGGTAGNFQAGRQYSVSLDYRYGPLLVTAAMYDGNAGGTAATTPIPSTVAFIGRTIGATYTFGQAAVKLAYTLEKIAGSFDNRIYSGGGRYQITPAVAADAGVWYTSDGNNTNNHSILAATGVTYSLSKATLLYGQFGYVDNHGFMHVGLSTNGALFGATGSTFGTAIGIRHLF
jgi:predicted porin